MPATLGTSRCDFRLLKSPRSLSQRWKTIEEVWWSAYPGFGNPRLCERVVQSDLERQGQYKYGSQDVEVMPKCCALLKTHCTENLGLLYTGLCTAGKCLGL